MGKTEKAARCQGGADSAVISEAGVYDDGVLAAILCKVFCPIPFQYIMDH